jgi:rare lipoprotein A (peptidoglycan hydrolase)
MTKVIRNIITAFFLFLLCTPALCWGEFSLPMHVNIQYSLASWYGHAFHGKQTASGQLFDMNRHTCAHKSYPFGTWLKITNTVNNKSTFCVVNDRGPFEAVRDLDLSFAAAKVLDMISLGTCIVRIEYMGIDPAFMKTLIDFFHDRPFIKSHDQE